MTSSGYILNCSTIFASVPLGTWFLPSPKLASKLQWPASTNLDTLSTFFLISLVEVSVHQKYTTRCQAAGLSTPELPGLDIRTILNFDKECRMWQPHHSRYNSSGRKLMIGIHGGSGWFSMCNRLILFCNMLYFCVKRQCDESAWTVLSFVVKPIGRFYFVCETMLGGTGSIVATV